MENKERIKNIYKSIASTADKDVSEKILRFKPINKSEFASIYNFTPRLLQKNANLIMELETLLTDQRVSKIDRKVFMTINLLQEKLTNISQKNNMIWNQKESEERLLDLSKTTPKTISEIDNLLSNLNSKGKVKLEVNVDEVKKKAISLERELKKNTKTGNIQLSKEEIFDSSVKKWFYPLYLENKKLITEKGRTSLYISPITILGKVLVEDKTLSIRAPLFLFPVKIELDKQRTSWILSNDHGRGVITNDFVKSYCLNDMDFEYDEEKNLEENTLMFLENFSNVSDEREKNYKEFSLKPSDSDFKLNNYVLRKNILMGIFAEFGNSIQNEVKNQIKTNKIPTQLSRFVSEKDVNTINEKKSIDEKYEKVINNDKELYYTNDLNSSQLEALKKINDPDSFGLTIWGPPGTGKSETIIAIIQDAIAKNKRILVVSEKQAALDVISNRLGSLKKSSIVISDEKNKKIFFDQLKENYEESKKEIEFKDGQDKTQENSEYFDDIEKIYGENNYVKEVLKIYDDKYYFNKDVSEILSYSQFRKLDFKNDLGSFFKTKEDIDSFKSIEEVEVLDIINDGDALSFGNLKPYREHIRESVSKSKGILMDNKEILGSLKDIENHINIFNGITPGNKKASLKTLTNEFQIDKKEIKKFVLKDFKKKVDELIKSENSKLEELNKIDSLLEDHYYEFEKIFHLHETTLSLLKPIIKTYNKSKDFITHRRDFVSALIEKIMIKPEYQKYLRVIEDFNSIKKNVEKNNILIKNYNNKVINENLQKVINDNIYTERMDAFEKMINREKPPAIRKFMTEFPLETKNQIRIWLLQPEVVPLIFDINEIFDIVIFDEASQMFMERAIPAISRSEKIVVLGDEKQLGPSNFFAGRFGEDNDEELFDENESLLSYSKAKLPTIMLRNHYRSEKLSLINFSNENYYEGKLNFINSVNTKYKNEIEYHFVEGAVYNEQSNVKEADKVVSILKRLKKEGVKESIGIITVNQKQQEIIENKIFFDSTLVDWVIERDLFIKSLENIQGDERHIIIIATNFAKDSSSGKLRMNFGPISTAMGSNRINVAITRAKQKMIIVSSIVIEEARSKFPKLKNQGPKDFINFIAYARDVSEGKFDYTQNEEENTEGANNVFKSEVYDEVVNELKTKYNLGIFKNYKSLGYKIDFVLYDLKTKDEIVAVELDYLVERASSRARERDFLSEDFLNKRGWKVYRIWSTDWWRDKEMTKKRFFLEIKNILSERK